MLFHRSLLLIATAFVYASALDVHYTDCGSSVPVGQVTVEPCTRIPCELSRGGKTRFGIHFQPEIDAGYLGQVEARTVVWGVAVPIPLGSTQICGHVHPNCPLQPGQWYKYSSTIPIDKSYSRMTVPIQWLLKDSDGNLMVCVEIQVEIV
ncbi:NPC intracellular cholesterol transporter 2 a [Clonorchis sinensis]|uniref:NPC intracellular cholesterol transporter 2 a n=1 Tax=Clonorchis sinensis TaxID=79923 RepID=A0A419PVX8_CLOSI|nr:NPC intracellular cholesterol transporter 2 a [Clonorchis sinensis]